VDWSPVFAWDHPSYVATQTTQPPYLQNWNQPPQIQPDIKYTGNVAVQCDAGRPSTGHSNGSVVTLCDGSVKVVSGAVGQPTWQAAILPEDGNVPSSYGDW
jgi:hypothetical protein